MEKNSNWQSFKIIAEKNATEIVVGSEAEFITEHYWGYAKVDDRKSNEYEVRHPKWLKYDIINYEIAIDFELTYGQEFGFLNNLEPISVMLAEGSEITVENKRVVKNRLPTKTKRH